MKKHLWSLATVMACLLVAAMPARGEVIIVDDFEDGNLDEWSTTAGDPVGAWVTEAAAHDGTYGVEMGSLRTGWIFRLDAAAWVGWGDTFGCWTRINYEANGRTYFGFGVPYDYAGYSAVVGHNSQSFIIQYNAGLGQYEDLVSVSMTILLNHWYRVQVEWADGGVITASIYDDDGTLLNTISTTHTAITEGGMSLRSFGSVTSYFDTITRGEEPVATDETSWGRVKSLYR